MSKRTYNIYFHLHTVSGIIVTVALYVIFFAGAFTLFVGEIEEWEKKPEPAATHIDNGSGEAIDYDRTLAALKLEGFDLYGRYIYVGDGSSDNEAYIYMDGMPDSLASDEDKKERRFSLDKTTYKITEHEESTSFSLGSLLYDLHFFNQMGTPGYYMSGVVSAFFLFAIISGIIVHWKKIVSNFYLFRPYEKLKTVWTDAHTALGTIGLPFQFMYAVTGAMFGLGVLVATSGSLLYGGDEEKFYGELYGAHSDSVGTRIDPDQYTLNVYADSAMSMWNGFKVTGASISKCESSTMQFEVYGIVDSKDNFYNGGEVVFDVVPGTINHMHNPFQKSYDEAVWPTVYRLHFASFDLPTWPDFGVKTLYFLMTVATCFVMVTGVLIWLEARNKVSVPEKERKFNEAVGHIYMAICLSMFPVTAFSFIVTKIVHAYEIRDASIIINSVFFIGWLATSIFFWRMKNNYLTNKYTLLSAGILGICIPVVNGVVGGNWLWNTWIHQEYGIFMIDVLWIALSGFSLLTVYKLQPVRAYNGSGQLSVNQPV